MPQHTVVDERQIRFIVRDDAPDGAAKMRPGLTHVQRAQHRGEQLVERFQPIDCRPNRAALAHWPYLADFADRVRDGSVRTGLIYIRTSYKSEHASLNAKRGSRGNSAPGSPYPRLQRKFALTCPSGK